MMSPDTLEEVVKEEWAKGINCEAREWRAQARDQVSVWINVALSDYNTWGGERLGVEAKTPGIWCVCKPIQRG